MTHTLLITGGTGTLGRAITRAATWQVAGTPVWTFARDVSRALWPDKHITGDVCDRWSVRRAIRACRPSAVIHAAANKHLGDCERCPSHALRVNVEGSRNVIEACAEEGVPLLLVSTDKAASPTGVYGMGKYLAERLAVEASVIADVRAIRLANILGSTGSVWQIWRDRIRRGEPITVRGRGMTRYVLHPQRAAELCLRSLAVPAGRIVVPKCDLLSIDLLAEVMTAGTESRIFREPAADVEKQDELLLSPLESVLSIDCGEWYEIGETPTAGVQVESRLLTAPDVREMHESLIQYYEGGCA
jgi:UDP-N-acetylglucosamine 4,6-dehydratase/5-epimerase